MTTAGATNTETLSKIGPKYTPTSGNLPNPAAPIANRAIDATRKATDSFPVMFKNPTSKPSINNANAAVPAGSNVENNPVTIARSTPSINDHSPKPFDFLRAIVNSYNNRR